jgi:hypothetical protein
VRAILEAVEIPPKMRLLDRDRRGYPVPWIVQRDLTGRPFFIVNDTEKTLACGRRGLCGICGRKMERDVWLIGGPGAAFHEHGAYLDPPMHRQCATYALRVCPYLGTRYTGRIDAALFKHGKWPANMRAVLADSMIPEQPPFFVMAKTARASMTVEDRMPRFRAKRPWLAVQFWQHGRQVTEPEARELLASSSKWTSLGELVHWQAE